MAAILVVDDNEKNLRLLSDVLSAQGYTVHTAMSGPEALERARTLPIDLVLMDVQLPGMSGTEAMHLLRREAGLTDVPFLAVTALAMRGDKAQLLEAGFNGYISKPLTLKEIVGTVRNFLDTGA